MIVNRAAVASLLLSLMSGAAYAAQSLTSITSSQLESGVVQIVVEGTEQFTSKPASFSVDTPPRIIVDVEGSSGMEQKSFPVGKAGVDSLVVVEANDRARLVARLQSKQPYEITTKGNQLLITIGESGAKATGMPQQKSSMATVTPADSALPDAGKLSLNFQDIEVRSVLQLLADFTGLNMVVSDTVRGNVTLRLKDVHWQQALDIILKTKGLSMRQEGNIIMVAPTAEVAAQEQLAAEAENKLQTLQPLKSDLVRIKYAKANELAELMKSDANRLLSDRGSVTVDTRTNTLLIRDTEESIRDIRSLIAKLDRPIKQVMIESRIVIANDDYAKELGVRLGFSGTEDNVTIGGGYSAGGVITDGAYGDVYDADSGESLFNVNLPASTAAAQGGAFNFIWGVTGSHILQLELSAMQQEGKGEIVSSPRVVTSDQNTASIQQGVEIPYQESTSSGATNISFKEAVLELEVTPHITPDDKIIMDLVVKKDNPDFSREINGVPPIDTRQIETSVLVNNGETIVLGGIFEQVEQSGQDKVPVLGDIPAIGRLFKRDSKRNNKTELMVFVTPKILRN